MATLAELKSRFQLMAADDGTYWSPTEVVTWLNDAQSDFASRTLSVRESTTIPLTTGTAVYTLPSKTIRVLRVTHNGRPLYRENEPRLDRLIPNWMSSTPGAPSSYLHGLEGSTKLRLYPAPDSTAATNPLGVIVAKTPADFPPVGDPGHDTAVSEVPVEYHHALVLYALTKAYLKDGDNRNPEKANIFWQQYMDQVELATDYVARSLNRGQMVGFDGTPRDAERRQ